MNDYAFWVIIAFVTALCFGWIFRAMLVPLKIFRKIFMVILPIAALILYVNLGLPDFETLPNQVKANQITKQAVEKIESRLEKGIYEESLFDIELLVRYYQKIQNYPKLVFWTEKLYQLNPSDKDVYAFMIEAKILNEGGLISNDIGTQLQAYFKNANGIKNPMIPYYLALYYVQQNQIQTAIPILQAILRESYADDEWVPIVVEALKYCAEQEKQDLKNLLVKPKMAFLQ